MADLEHELRSLVDASPTIDADEVRARAARPNRWEAPARRSIVVAVAVVLFAAIVLTGIVLVRSGGSSDRNVIVPAQQSPAPVPEEIVTIAEDGRVVVLDRAGEPLRLLTGGAYHRPGQVSVAPDGEVYFYSAALQTAVEIPSAGGVGRKVLGDACCIWFPSASPDGRWLAYSGVPNQSDGGRDILLRSRSGADPATYDRRWSGTSTLNTGIEILGWSPDSSSVVFVDHDANDPRPRVLDITTPQSESLDDQPVLELPPGQTFAGYRGPSGELLLIDHASAPNQVSAWKPTTDRTEALFALDGVHSVSADPSGNHLLAVSDAGLYRWTTGDTAPTQIADTADGIVAAAWLPTTREPGANADTTTTTAKVVPATASTAQVPLTTIVADQPPLTPPNRQPPVQVLNASGIQGAATMRSNDLKARGWQVLAPGNAPATRTGAAIQCAKGFAAVATQLRTDLEYFGVDATIEPLEDPMPVGYDTAAACYVILGR